MNIRIGNDFKTKWAITWLGEPEDFSDATDISLSFNIYDKKIELTRNVDYTITDNIIEIDCTPDICDILGTYNLELHYTKPNDDFIDGERRSAVDIDAFRIVGKSDKADVTQDVSIISDAVAIFLDIAYKKLEEIEANEVIRITNEGERKDAEDIRVENEATRISNEAIRVSSEEERDSSETIRVQNESERIAEESVRQNNESARVSEESVRQNNEANRISAEALRVQAEGEREVSEVEREESEDIRVANENIRISNEQDRQINTTTAISDAEQATLNANNSAVYANEQGAYANEQGSYAEEMSSHPPTIINDYWHIWNFTTNQYESTGQYARGDSAVDGALVVQTTGQSAVNTMSQKAVTDSLVQLAGEVSLLDAVQGAKIKDIENVLSTANLGQSAQLSVSGRKVVSLPKNAANGGMQVKLEGLTAENLVVNGDFSDGDTNAFFANASLVDGWAKIDAPIGVASAAGLDAPITLGDIYYGRTLVKFNTSLNKGTNKNGFIIFRTEGAASANWGTTNNSERSAGDIITFSNRGVISDSRSARLLLALYHPTEITSASVKDLMLINLTTIFGAGNEPTKEECDLIFSDYFEGVKSFEPTGRVRSVDKNGLNPTALYLTASELRSNGTVKDEIRKGANGYELVKNINEVDGTVLATPVITPISYGGVLNSAENGTVYHEPVIADAGVYGTNMPILLTDYPIASIEEIIKHEDGVDTYLDVSTAVIASDKLSFTHPSLVSGDLVLFTYAYDKESTNGNITATFYDSNVVKIDTVTGKAYRINEVVTNGVLTRTLTEV